MKSGSARWQTSFCSPEESYGPKSGSGCAGSLAGRSGFRKFLCALPLGEALVVGNLLAGRGGFQLDFRSRYSGLGDDEGFAGGPFGSAAFDSVLDILFRADVGDRRAPVRPAPPLPGALPGL